MKQNDESLKLIYVLKVGHNVNNNGIYEFIFSKDPTNIDEEGWCWDISPACNNAAPPTKEYIDAIYTLKTNTFDLFCLHEAVDREYKHGYNTIHALAYEIDKENCDKMIDDYDELFDENLDDYPLLVFHYGVSLNKIKEMFKERKIILRGNDFIEVSAIEIK